MVVVVHGLVLHSAVARMVMLWPASERGTVAAGALPVSVLAVSGSVAVARAPPLPARLSARTRSSPLGFLSSASPPRCGSPIGPGYHRPLLKKKWRLCGPGPTIFDESS